MVCESGEPHILDISAQICDLDYIHRNNLKDPLYKPAYFSSLAAMFASPPTPDVFTDEPSRLNYVLDCINDAETAIFYDDYSHLASKVEMERTHYGVTYWASDTHLANRPHVYQAEIAEMWLDKLVKEAAELQTRPPYWCIRIDESGEYDRHYYSNRRTQALNIDEVKNAIDEVGASQAEGGVGYKQMNHLLPGLGFYSLPRPSPAKPLQLPIRQIVSVK